MFLVETPHNYLPGADIGSWSAVFSIEGGATGSIVNSYSPFGTQGVHKITVNSANESSFAGFAVASVDLQGLRLQEISFYFHSESHNICIVPNAFGGASYGQILLSKNGRLIRLREALGLNIACRTTTCGSWTRVTVGPTVRGNVISSLRIYPTSNATIPSSVGTYFGVASGASFYLCGINRYFFYEEELRYGKMPYTSAVNCSQPSVVPLNVSEKIFERETAIKDVYRTSAGALYQLKTGEYDSIQLQIDDVSQVMKSRIDSYMSASTVVSLVSDFQISSSGVSAVFSGRLVGDMSPTKNTRKPYDDLYYGTITLEGF